jgi:repressor LexA
MVEIGINDGDYVVAKRQQNAESGEIVVAMIDGNATVKTFYREKERIRLQPENCTYSPIYSTDVTILGKVIGCLRRM